MSLIFVVTGLRLSLNRLFLSKLFGDNITLYDILTLALGLVRVSRDSYGAIKLSFVLRRFIKLLLTGASRTLYELEVVSLSIIY